MRLLQNIWLRKCARYIIGTQVIKEIATAKVKQVYDNVINHIEL